MSGPPIIRRSSPRNKLMLGVILLVLAGVVTLVYGMVTWPSVSTLARERPSTTAFIERFREEQRGSGRPDRVDWRWVPDESISPNLKLAVVTAEDIGFFSHHGFELGEMRHAVTEALRSGGAPRGASTITQQLAKNLWLSPSRNPLRKVKEAILTRQLEAALSKRRILELYLNVVELGHGIYGVQAGAQHYFGKSAADLTPHEAALLAASLPRPGSWNPGSESASYQRQVARIEGRMEKAKFLWSRLGATPVALDSGAIAAADSALSDLLRSDTLFQADTVTP